MFFYQISTLTDEVNTFDHVGNATVKGLIGGGDKVETWGVADTIAGGTAGSKMDLTAIVDADRSTVGRSTSGIETFNITFKDANDKASNSLTVDTSSLAGAKNFNIVSATAAHSDGGAGDSVKFTGLAQDQMVTVKSAAKDLDVELNYSEAASAGKEDVASFSLHNAKVGNVTVGTGMEAVKVTATGDNEVALIDATSATKFVFDGAGKLDTALNGGNGKIAEINASAMKGSLDLTISTAELNATKAVITGGTATDDVLNVDGAINAKMTVSGFETVGLGEGATTPATFDMSVVTGATTVANFDNDSTLTVKNATGVTNLLMEGLGSANVTSDVGIGAITFEAKALQDKLDVAINNAGVTLGDVNTTTEAKINAGALKIDNVKNITINAADADVVLASLTADKMESLTVTAKEDFTITDAVTFSNAAKVNMAGVVGDVSMTMQGSGGSGAFTTALNYTGSLAADHLILDTLTGKAGDKVAYTIDTGAGNDVVTLSGTTGAKADAVLTLNLGEGNDTLKLAADFKVATDSKGDGQTIDFGAGTGDTLEFNGGSAALDLSAATVTGLEELKLTTAAANKLTINDETANGLKVVNAYTDATVLNVTMTKGNDLDVHGLTLNGTGAKLNITGSANNDTIVGANYASTITGGAGADTITLGTAACVVNYTSLATVKDQTGITLAAADSIIGFTSGTDKIKTDAAGTNDNYAEAVAAVDFAAALVAANAALTGTKVYYLTSTAADGGLLFVDSDGDNAADAVIKLSGVDSNSFAFGDIVGN